jgi:hypothetical protein
VHQRLKEFVRALEDIHGKLDRIFHIARLLQVYRLHQILLQSLVSVRDDNPQEYSISLPREPFYGIRNTKFTA